MTTPRVVLDSNVLVSALLFHAGSMSWLRLAWPSERIRPLVSHDTAAELIRVLSYPKFRLTAAAREDLLGDYLPWCEAATVPGIVAVPDCRDPGDRPFLALARATRADALVTGDADLLVLAGGFEVPILTPTAFKERIDGTARRGIAGR
jgi:putative PIN family toxin of toxin-antitoxin system